LTGVGPVPVALRALETPVAFDRRRVRANQERLADPDARREPDLLIVCSHEPDLFAAARFTVS